ncbi:MAG: hypothetical protein QM489_00735 [Candidatus Izemoplasma sp.]
MKNKQRIEEIETTLKIIKSKLSWKDLAEGKILKMKTHYNELVVEYNSYTVLKKKFKLKVKS